MQSHRTTDLYWLQSIAELARPLALVVAILFTSAPASAQLEDAYSANFQNLKKLAPMLVEAAEKKDRDSAFARSNEIRENLDYLEKRVNDTKSNLHEDDQKWYEERKEKLVRTVSKLRVSTGTLAAALKEVGKGYDSYLSDFKSDFNAFHAEFQTFMQDLRNRRMVLEQRIKKWGDAGIRG